MFTGLVEATGTVRERSPLEGGAALVVETPLADEMEEGESVALDGACLSVAGLLDGAFRVEAIRTTLSRTTLGEWEAGRPVNLERALRLGDRLGGHLVQGHVDGVGEVTSVERADETVFVWLRMPEEVARTTVPRGSLAVDGVSLTVNGLEGRVAEVALIPYTWRHTTMDRLAPGTRVNLEADLMGKYVERLVRPYRTGAVGPEDGAADRDASTG